MLNLKQRRIFLGGAFEKAAPKPLQNFYDEISLRGLT